MAKRKPKEIYHSFAKDYSEVYYELETFRGVLTSISDIDLVDFLLPYHTDLGYDMDGVMDCYVRLNRDEDLTPEERKKMEHFYLMINTDLGFDV